ncbi:M48 family metallopeptidase [Clostridium sp. D53t1_180928_C8]|uniref:M48 family metallopeptidase n=1 Tax=Clostridium sp. D53t1_180928_C8 TaxID=2787101 RepID=UPI0018AB0716|nr:M48 family metallopeptidase [Clostridium sp. D53t1_180928_C8]
MNRSENNNINLTKKEIESCRHKSEKKWYGILLFINFSIIIAVIIFCIINISSYNTLPNTIIESFLNPSSYADIIMSPSSALNNFPTELQLLLTGIVAIIAFPFGINLYYAKYRSRAIKITENNFPEVYNNIAKFSHKIDLKKVPEALLIQQNGVMNAFSAFIIRKQYIEIDSDLFEIAYREYNDLESINFIIAHELAHIKYKHATFYYNLFIMFSTIIPIIGSTASRAREYSCDRLAQKITGNTGVEAIFSLFAGKHLYKRIDVYDYINNSNDINGFFVWCNNLISSHPILPKRIRALINSEDSGELY